MPDDARLEDRSRSGQRRARPRPPFECIALLLQGGGALGAYQAGVYEALVEEGLHPDWTCGISIGAINAALIAGNAPEHRVDKLRQFWELVTSHYPEWAFPRNEAVDLSTWRSQFDRFGDASDYTSLLRGDTARSVVNQWSAARAASLGASGFFAPRPMTPWLWPRGTIEATSYYDTRPLKATLERLVDFDRINSGAMRLSVGAVNVRTGNIDYFDTTTHKIRVEHIMASGALPPGFPAIEIDGELYWDGGLISNTPLRWVVESEPQRDTIAFQVDLWASRGRLPRNMAQVLTRQKEIQYSSRTRAASDRFRELQTLRHALARLIEKLPPELAESPEAAVLRPVAQTKVWNLIQLIYRSQEYEGDSKDYEFSRWSMQDHWRTGYHDTARTLKHPHVLERPRSADGIFMFDVDDPSHE
jgi:NTE family protein